jgi:hypothetical protein
MLVAACWIEELREEGKQVCKGRDPISLQMSKQSLRDPRAEGRTQDFWPCPTPARRCPINTALQECTLGNRKHRWWARQGEMSGLIVF